MNHCQPSGWSGPSVDVARKGVGRRTARGSLSIPRPTPLGALRLEGKLA